MDRTRAEPIASLVFNRLSAHLDRLAEQTSEVEEAIGASLSDTSMTRTISITKFQSLDFIRQSLEDCALLVHYMSKDTSLQCLSVPSLSENVSKLKLDVTRSIVEVQPQAIQSSKNDSGEIDLF